jgi:hypothetical protein
VARVAATGPMKATAARRMRATASVLDDDHPETIAGDHVRDAAQMLQRGLTDAAGRHLDAAMELLTPRNLYRHGITDDEGHATAKHHMHQVHRHRLAVQDIEDVGQRNDRLRAAARAARDGLPPPDQQDGQAAVGLAVELAFRYKHGWVLIANAASLHGQVLHGQDRHFRPVHGRYDHITSTINDAKRGRVPVRQVAKTLPPERRRSPLHLMPRTQLSLATELSARTAMLERTPAPRGRPGGPGLYHVQGMGHTPYLQQIVKALIDKRGMPSDKAYRIARGAIRKWMRGGGHVHPEVRAAAGRAEAGELTRQARAHTHAVSGWEIADTLIELACEPIELFNPYHAPPGTGGGQFTTASGAGQGAKGKQAQQKQAARGEHRLDVKQRRTLLKRAAALRSQIRALQAQLPQPRGARKAAKVAKAKTAAQLKAAAARKAKAGATPRKKGVAAKRLSPATIHAKINALRAELQGVLAQLKRV